MQRRGSKRPIPAQPSGPVYQNKKQSLALRSLTSNITAHSSLGVNVSSDGSTFQLSLDKASLHVPRHATDVYAALTQACIPNTWGTTTAATGEYVSVNVGDTEISTLSLADEATTSSEDRLVQLNTYFDSFFTQRYTTYQFDLLWNTGFTSDGCDSSHPSYITPGQYFERWYSKDGSAFFQADATNVAQARVIDGVPGITCSTGTGGLHMSSTEGPGVWDLIDNQDYTIHFVYREYLYNSTTDVGNQTTLFAHVGDTKAPTSNYMRLNTRSADGNYGELYWDIQTDNTMYTTAQYANLDTASTGSPSSSTVSDAEFQVYSFKINKQSGDMRYWGFKNGRLIRVSERTYAGFPTSIDEEIYLLANDLTATSDRARALLTEVIIQDKLGTAQILAVQDYLMCKYRFLNGALPDTGMTNKQSIDRDVAQILMVGDTTLSTMDYEGAVLNGGSEETVYTQMFGTDLFMQWTPCVTGTNRYLNGQRSGLSLHQGLNAYEFGRGGSVAGFLSGRDTGYYDMNDQDLLDRCRVLNVDLTGESTAADLLTNIDTLLDTYGNSLQTCYYQKRKALAILCVGAHEFDDTSAGSFYEKFNNAATVVASVPATEYPLETDYITWDDAVSDWADTVLTIARRIREYGIRVLLMGPAPLATDTGTVPGSGEEWPATTMASGRCAYMLMWEKLKERHAIFADLYPEGSNEARQMEHIYLGCSLSYTQGFWPTVNPEEMKYGSNDPWDLIREYLAAPGTYPTDYPPAATYWRGAKWTTPYPDGWDSDGAYTRNILSQYSFASEYDYDLLKLPIETFGAYLRRTVNEICPAVTVSELCRGGFVHLRQTSTTAPGEFYSTVDGDFLAPEQDIAFSVAETTNPSYNNALLWLTGLAEHLKSGIEDRFGTTLSEFKMEVDTNFLTWTFGYFDQVASDTSTFELRLDLQRLYPVQLDVPLDLDPTYYQWTPFLTETVEVEPEPWNTSLDETVSYFNSLYNGTWNIYNHTTRDSLATHILEGLTTAVGQSYTFPDAEIFLDGDYHLVVKGLAHKVVLDFTNAQVFLEKLGLFSSTTAAAAASYSYTFEPDTTTIAPTAVSFNTYTTASVDYNPIIIETNFTTGGVNQRGEHSLTLAVISHDTTEGDYIIYTPQYPVRVLAATTLKGEQPTMLEFRLVDKDKSPIPVGTAFPWWLQLVVEWQEEIDIDLLKRTLNETQYN